MKKLLPIALVISSLIAGHECGTNWLVEGTEDGIILTVKEDYKNKLFGRIGRGLNFSDPNCVQQRNCTDLEYDISHHGDYITVTWETNDTSRVFEDCFDLEVGTVNWYGGPERHAQQWPIEKISQDGSVPYVLRKDENYSIMERYWLNSRGAYIFVDDKVPLFVDQNNKRDGQVCFIAKVDGPYFNRTRNLLQYNLVAERDPKDAHLHAVRHFLGKPSGHPDRAMIREPIWTTWAKYKSQISDEIVLDFAAEVRAHGFENGQIEIDDSWETCYGSHEFNTETFPNITDVVRTLKADNWRVTLWTHPFVDDNCQNDSDIGKENGYFVKNNEGSTTAVWWNGDNSHQIDFTKPEAVQWFSDKLKLVQERHGIDSFKFDAGETNYAPQPSVYENVDQELIPNILSKKYIAAVSEFGDLIEVRSGWRTQELGMFVRMIDKDSNWVDVDNGLHSLITTLLQMNLNGYTMVLPDIIGGNAYGGDPTAELLARWTQANAFMPAMQFSSLPWDITSDEFDGVEIVRKFVNLHANYTNEIIVAMDESILFGYPVNPPIWWIDPTDPVALANDDEYLLGQRVLVAPVITEGARSRDVYLPKGTWRDGNNQTEYTGPVWLTNYPAPIDVLPYFLKV